MDIKAVLMDSKAIQRAITRIAHEIIEKNKGTEDLIFVGIKSRGVPLAERLAQKIYEIEEREISVYQLDITRYRDDNKELRDEHTLLDAKILPIEGKIVVLVDDVIYTGRTVRAALDALTDIARPRKVQLAVLIDRGHRELPIRADFIGKNVPTSSAEIVAVKLSELDLEDNVFIYTNEV